MTSNPLKRKWGRKEPSNSNEEYEQLKQFYKEEAEGSGEDDPGLRRRRWRKAIEKYIQEGWPISLRNIDTIWANLTNGEVGQAPDAKQEVSRPLAWEAVKTLFDFSTDAIEYDSARSPDFVGKKHEEHEYRIPKGINPQQNIFLEELQVEGVEAPPRSGELDKFAMAIADLDGYDGIYFLSGVRGSGKTSTLNRVAWYCEQWFYRTSKPLLVRFDLGVTFNREVFLRDLLAEICLAAKRTLRRKPFSLSIGLGWPTRVVGHLGRFCQINILWAMIAAILGILLAVTYLENTSHATWFGTIILHTEANTNQGSNTNQHEKNDSNITNQHEENDSKIFKFNKTDYKFLLLGLFSVIALGIVYAARSLFPFQPDPHDRQRSGNLTRNVIVFVIMVVVLFEIFSGGLLGTRLNSFGQISDNTHMNSYFLCLLVMSFGVFFLPTWWESYLYFDRILSRVRSEPNQRVSDMPIFAPMGSFSWYLSRLLPTSESSEQLDKISEPFLQELMKQVLSECTRTFPRVVFLIDDLDALPSREFHGAMRLLRPISKVPGVRCILATPLFFHYVLGNENPSDVHSTVQASIVVGNPRIFPDFPEDTEKITPESEILREFLVDLIVSRFRLKLREDSEMNRDEFNKIIQKTNPFEFILQPWIQDKDELIFELFRKFGTSRREIIRVVREALYPKIRDKSQKQERSRVMKNYGSTSDRLKLDYRQQENVLDCHIGIGETRINQTASQELDKYPEITPQVENLIRFLDGERTRTEILQGLGLKDRANLAKKYLRPALDAGLIEMTIPDVPRSRKQKYRLTNKGRELQERLK